MKQFLSVLRFDVDVPGGRVYKESNFTEAGIFFQTHIYDIQVK